MTMWDVHVTFRDESGTRRTEFHGAFAPEELSQGLEGALERAARANGGVQVTRQRPLPRPSSGPHAA